MPKLRLDQSRRTLIAYNLVRRLKQYLACATTSILISKKLAVRLTLALGSLLSHTSHLLPFTIALSSEERSNCLEPSMDFMEPLRMLSTPTSIAVSGTLFLATFLFYRWLLPKPIPGIPYSKYMRTARVTSTDRCLRT